jgi:hypothetical protein
MTWPHLWWQGVAPATPWRYPATPKGKMAGVARATPFPCFFLNYYYYFIIFLIYVWTHVNFLMVLTWFLSNFGQNLD